MMSTERDRLPGTEAGRAGRATPAQPGLARAAPCKRPAGRVPALPRLHTMDTKTKAGERNGGEKGLVPLSPE